MSTQFKAHSELLLSEQVKRPGAQSLLNRPQKHCQALLLVLAHPNVPHDNNVAERTLQNLVIHREVTGGFHSETGANAHAILSSVVDIPRKRGEHVLGILRILCWPSDACRTRSKLGELTR